MTEAKAEKRFPQLTVADLTPAQHVVADEVLKVSSLGIQGPYNVMLRSPVMAQRMVALLDYLRFNNSLPLKLSELAILVQARIWTSQVEWKAHYPIAVKAGLSEAVAADVNAGRRPTSMQPDEALVYDLCMELGTSHQVSDATFARAQTLLTDQQIVDLVTCSGITAPSPCCSPPGRNPHPMAPRRWHPSPGSRRRNRCGPRR
jgi:4-carboxymuconolactone decarboxylase